MKVISRTHTAAARATSSPASPTPDLTHSPAAGNGPPVPDLWSSPVPAVVSGPTRPKDPRHGHRPDRTRLHRLLPGARTPPDHGRHAGAAARRPGAVHDLRDAPAHALPGGPPPSPGAPSGQCAALSAHHRSRRGRRLHAPDGVRDARFVVARRLRALAEPPLGVRAAPRGLRHPARQTARHGLRRRRAGGPRPRLAAHLGGVGGPGGAHRGGQLVVQRSRGPVRPGLGDLRVDRRRPAAGHAHDGPALGGGLEPRPHAVPPSRRRLPPAPGASRRRHRHGSRAPRHRPPGP